MNIIQKLLAMIANVQGAKNTERQIAKHLAKVALYNLRGEDALYPDVKTKYIALRAKMEELDMPVYMFEGFRTAQKQNSYYNQGRTTSGNIITNAKGLQSYHQYGLAFDVIFENGRWNPPSSAWWDILGNEGKKLGLDWGGDFGDRPHFSWHPGFQWSILESYFK